AGTAGTAWEEYRWYPPLSGIEEVAVLQGDMTPGADHEETERGVLRQVRSYVGMTTKEKNELFQAQLGIYPAAVLAWTGMRPIDGPNFASPGPRSARLSADSILYRHLWVIFVIVYRHDSEVQRSMEGQSAVTLVTNALQG